MQYLNGTRCPSHAATPSQAVRSADAGKTAQQIVRKHNFGVLRPGTKARCELLIENGTDSPWVIAKFESSCGCLVGEPSHPIVPARGSRTIPITYQAGGEFKDVAKSVVVRFSDSTIPPWRLDIRAKVRPEIVLDSTALDFGELSPIGSRTRVVNVFNYSSEDWIDLKVAGVPSWLNMDVVQKPLGASRDGLRQLWAVALTAQIKPQPQSKSRLRSQLTFAARTPTRTLTDSLAVEVRVVPPVMVIPEILFFGSVRPGEYAERTVSIRFLPDNAPKSEDEFSVESQLGCVEDVQITRGRKPNLWRLTVGIRPVRDDSDQVHGRLRVDCLGAIGETVDIPVFAAIQDE